MEALASIRAGDFCFDFDHPSLPRWRRWCFFHATADWRVTLQCCRPIWFSLSQQSASVGV